MKANQTELFEPENQVDYIVFFELVEKGKLEKTRPMTLEQCVDFIEFLKVMGYRWRYTHIQPIT
jgi:hypothetical protein